MIGTYRPVDVIVHDHPLGAIAHELRRRRRCNEISLAGLSEAGVAAYLAERFTGHTFPAALSKLLWERTEGHPLFLVALIEEWEARELLQPQEGHWVMQRTLVELAATVPEHVRQLIEHQLAKLSPTERSVLEAASAAGLQFSAAAVAAALETELETIEERYANLARRQLFLQPQGQAEWPDGTVAECYAFRHVLYQQVVYRQLPAGRRSALHRRIGACLEAAYAAQAGEIASALAEHFEQGRDPVRAVRYHRLAGETALARQAPQEALGHLKKALVLIPRWPEDHERGQEELRLQTALGVVLLSTENPGAPAPCTSNGGTVQP